MRLGKSLGCENGVRFFLYSSGFAAAAAVVVVVVAKCASGCNKARSVTYMIMKAQAHASANECVVRELASERAIVLQLWPEREIERIG